MANGRPPRKRPARWSPFAGIARIRSLGVAVQPLRCPASQPSRRDSGYPTVGAVQLPRSPRRQYRRCTARRTGAQGRKPRHARAERRVPDASSSTDPAPYPVLSTAFLAASPDPPGSAQSGSAAETRGLAGRRRSCVQDPGRKIIYWRSLSAACRESMACRESIYDRPDTGRDDGTGGYSRIVGQALSPRRSHVLGNPQLRLSARFRSSTRTSRAEGSCATSGEAPRDRRRCRLPGSTLSHSVPARLTCQAAASPRHPHLVTFPVTQKALFLIGRGP
jgi:hypothetical protein